MDLNPPIIRRYFDSKLSNIRWKNGEGIVRCPFHKDRRPSLSVNAEMGVFNCHACNSKGGLVEFERRISACDLKTARGRIAKLANRGGGSHLRSQIVTVYSYADEKGKLRYQQVRFKPKDFRFRRPAEDGGWIWNLQGVQKILYNLPEVIAADKVFIAEGEKDVERLRSWGLVATCNPGGAGKWREEYSQVLKNKKVIILQDDDEPGRKHAQAVAKSVVRYAAEVRVIQPFPKAKDVTEWIERGGTKRRLEDIIAGAAPLERSPALDGSQLETQSLSKNDWRLRPLRGAMVVRMPEAMFLDYLISPDGVPFVSSLWTIGTHMFEIFDCFPYLTITSPVKRCGKSQFGKVLNLLCCRPFMNMNISEAALFRLIDAEKPTLILEEAEALRNKASERSQYLLSILQGGFTQGTFVPRCVGKTFEVVKFSVYCPKAILAIGNLPDTLMDRSIIVSMRRRLKSEVVARFRRRIVAEQADGIVNVLSAWAAAHKDEVHKAYLKQNLEFLQDREADIWEPLFAIASVAVPERLEELKRIAIRLSNKKTSMDADDSEGLQLLSDIRTFFSNTKYDGISSSGLVEWLQKVAANHWEKELTQTKLARLLRPFGIRPDQIWIEERNARGYRREQFKSAFECYLPPETR